MSGLDDPRVCFAAERTLMTWSRTGLTLMAFGLVLERFGLFLHMARATPDHTGRDLSFWIGIAFIVLALWSVGTPGIVMSFSVLLLGMALLAYLFWEF